MSDTIDIGIARKARDAEAELAKARADNAALAAQLDAFRAAQPGLDTAKTAGHGIRCSTSVEGGGRHPIVIVNETDRSVRCKQCGAKLDAFDVLMEYASCERRFFYANTAVRREHDRLKREVEAMKLTVRGAKVHASRVDCPRGCGAKVAPSMATGGVAPHACYSRRARRGMVPASEATRWRVVQGDGAALTQWSDEATARRLLGTRHGARVEEYKGAIGDAAERAAERVEAFAERETKRARRP